MIRTLHYSRAAGISILVIACLLMVGGCWGRTEVDDLAFVMSIGLDKGEDNTVYVTFQIAVPRAVAGGGGQGGEPGSGREGPDPSLITTMRGRSILGLVDMANTYIDRRLSFVHTKVLVIGEDLAREGVAPYVSELVRFHEIRRTMFLLVAKGTALEFITENKPILEQNPAKNLELLTLASRKAGLIPPSTLNRFLVEAQSQAEQPLVVLAGINKDQQSSKEQESQESKTDEEGTGSKSNSPLPDIPVATSDIRYFAGQSPSVGGNPVELLGAAVFRGDKMVGEITGEEVRQVLLLKGTFKQGIAVVRDSEAHDRFIAADLRLARPTQTRVTRDGDRFKIKVDVRLEGGLVGSQERGDYFDPKVLQAVETKLASEIQKGCRDIVRKAQTEFSSDIFGFGNKARHLTMTWKEWQDLNWNSEFPDADVEVSVQVELRRTGLLFRSPQPSAD